VKIVVTRPRDQAADLVLRLEALGHEVVDCPLLEIEPLGDGPVDVAGYDWLVVTSVNGARELRRRCRGPLPKVAAIGPATAAAMGGADFIPSVSTQEGLVAEFPGPPGRVLFAGAEEARPYLAKQLDADFVPLYRTVPVRPPQAPEGDLVVLASASAARAFARLRVDIPAVSIGPQTTQAARAEGVRVVAEAETHDVDGLVSLVEQQQRHGIH
jgi:uroporphyrinogen-III synthase